MSSYRFRFEVVSKNPEECDQNVMAENRAHYYASVIGVGDMLIVNEIEIYDVSAGDSTGHRVYFWSKNDN